MFLVGFCRLLQVYFPQKCGWGLGENNLQILLWGHGRESTSHLAESILGNKFNLLININFIED